MIEGAPVAALEIDAHWEFIASLLFRNSRYGSAVPCITNATALPHAPVPERRTPARAPVTEPSAHRAATRDASSEPSGMSKRPIRPAKTNVFTLGSVMLEKPCVAGFDS